MELIQKLGIDWKLLLAQIINFFILLFVLYKFVYKPVLGMLDKRTKIIEKGLIDAKESEERLRRIDQLREERMAAAEKEIGKLLEKAKADAETVKKDLAATASREAEDLLKRARMQIQEEKEKMIQDVKREISVFVVKAAGKLLEREFSQADQARLSEAVTKEMKSV